MARVLCPLPDRDFDVTEVVVPWKVLTDAGHEVVFATEGGERPHCDPLLLTGVVFGQLGAEPDACALYEELQAGEALVAPLVWSEVEPADFDALLLPGGHAQGMRQYLGSELLQEKVRAFWALDRPVAAICHGVLVLARAGCLTDVRTTCLPHYMEMLAYGLTFWKLGRYYRTYDPTVEEEVRLAMDPSKFERGPINLGKRGTRHDDSPAFVVEDGRYVSARWPGDAWAFARALLARL
jgi:putative intracellular protease/amidase